MLAERQTRPLPTPRARAEVVKDFGCRPRTEAFRRAETGPAFENLQGRKPRVGRALTLRDMFKSGKSLLWVNSRSLVPVGRRTTG
jgi:hypothetical protein